MAHGYDFVIFGASPLAALLSGLLAHGHGQQVLRVADPVPRHRLPRGINLALPFATRPATWRLLRASIAETSALLARIGGADCLDRVSVKFEADLPETSIALAHMAHVAAGYGFGNKGGRFGEVPRLAGLIDLTESAVQTVDSARVRVAFGPSGAELALDGEALAAGRVVLADDAAILSLLPEADRPPLLKIESMMATLTAPVKRLTARVLRYPDRGVTLSQGADRTVLALVSGQADGDARLGSCLPGPFPLQRRATTHYRRLVPADGAPFIGELTPSRLLVVAGLGDVGAFLAPPLARLLGGTSTDDEKAWFAAHDPAQASRSAVADVAGVWS